MKQPSFFGALNIVKAAISAESPSEAALSELRIQLKDPDVYREFWNMLNEPGWILPLIENGLLGNAVDLESTAVLQLGYLLKVAPIAPESSLAALASFQITTPSILTLLVEISLQLPPALSSQSTLRIVDS